MTQTDATVVNEPKQSQNLGNIIDELYAVKQEKKEVDAVSKKLGEQISKLEQDVRNTMADVGISQATGANAKVTVSEKTVATIQDWEETCNWIAETGSFYLLQRRISSTAYKDLLDAGEGVPGLKPTELPNLSIRKI